MKTCDKNMRPFIIGDILKVFHYTSPVRRERIYMYKQIIGMYTLGGGNCGDIPLVDYFHISHLNLSNDENYYIGQDDGVMANYEIIQGLKGSHKDRVKCQ